MQRLLTIFILISLVGCLNIGPDYKRPSLAVPENFKEGQNDKVWKTAEPGDAKLRGEWWSLYQDPYLNQLVQQALKNNQTLIAAEANYRQASALLNSYKSQQWPAINVNASDLRAKRSGTAVVAGGGRILNNYSLMFNANWELDIWGHIRRQVEAGEMSLLASQADFEVAKLSMLATLVQSYFQLRIFDTQSVLYAQTIQAYQKAYEVTRNRYAVGVASKSDVTQALAQIKTTQALATDIKLQRAQMEHLIATLQGVAPAAFSIAFKPYNTQDAMVLPQVPSSLPSALLERRPDIAAAERRVAAANANVGVAEAAFFPMLTLTPFVGYQSTKYNTLYNTPSRVWSIGPNISLPIFDGGLRRAQKASAIANYDATVATYRQTVLTGFQEVEDNLVAWNDLNEEVNLQYEAVKASTETLEQYQNRYQAGTVDYLGVVTLQTTLLSNQGTANTLQGRRLIASVNLIKALGGSWDDKAALSQSK